MTPSRQRWTARLLLACGVLAGLAWLLSLDRAKKISTDVLDLIPDKERSPELALVRTLAGERQSRVVLFALSVPGAGKDAETRTENAAAAFVAALARTPEFVAVYRADDTRPRDALARHLHNRRFDLLLPAWLASAEREYAGKSDARPWPAWLAERTAARLEEFLQKPEAVAFQNLIPSDPLLLLPPLVEGAQALATAGVGMAGGSGGPALIWAMTAEPPLSEKGQAPVFRAVERALTEARAVSAGADVKWAAVSRFAAQSRAEIESEMSGLNLLSLVAVLGIAALCIRRVHKVLHLAPVLLCSLLGAWVATTLAFDRVHVLVFVLGSLLGGVAIDYGFYLFLQPLASPEETAESKIRRLLRPLLASALTTILGFSLLFFSELPLIRQLGVFVSAGLLAALAAAVLWYSQVDDRYIETRAFIRQRTGCLFKGKASYLLLALGILAIVAGPWRLHWRDDIRSLEIPNRELTEEAASVRALFGESPGRTLYLTHGDNIAKARESLGRFSSWHAQERPAGSRISLGMLLPEEAVMKAHPARLAALSGFEEELRGALERHGFEAAGFEPFFGTWREHLSAGGHPSLGELARELEGCLQGPLTLAMGAREGMTWFATITTHGTGAAPEPPPELATVNAAQLESLNRLFSRYRLSALRLSSIGLALVGLSVFAIYGWREGPRIFALPAGSCLFAFGVFGLLGVTMNLFHLLGAFLGVCLSHNYAIFSAENAARGDAPPPSIRLSALTTALSFGVLALSKIPVVSALGAMVALIVTSALIVVETGAMAVRRDK